MNESNFVNATGWPDEGHYSTPYDLYLLGAAIIRDFPEYYQYYSLKEFTYNKITQQNRNSLLGRYEYADGLKTGHTEIAGYGITATAKKGKRRLFVVVNGLESMKERIDEAERLLKYGFKNYENIKLVHEYQTVGYIDVVGGSKVRLPIEAADGVIISVPKAKKDKLKIELVYESPIMAPVKKGAQIAKLVVTADGEQPREYPLLAAQSIDEASFFEKIIDNFNYYFLVW